MLGQEPSNENLTYEEQRQLKLEAKRKILEELQLETVAKELISKPTKKRVKREVEEIQLPARKSLRQQNKDPSGLDVPDAKAAKLEQERIQEEKLKRRQGDLTTFELIQEFPEETRGDYDDWNDLKIVEKDEIKATTSISELDIPYNDTFKVIKERIYSMAVHNAKDRILAFVGDKAGSLAGISFTKDLEWQEPTILTSLPLHRRPITTMKFHPDYKSLFAGSYEGSVRRFHLETGQFEELIGNDGFGVTHISLESPFTMYISDNDAELSHLDVRSGKVATFQGLHDRKIGHVCVNPVNSHLLATCSLDRTVKVWDSRKLSKKSKFIWEYETEKSCTSVEWNLQGEKLLTTSYDDKLQLFEWNDKDSKNIATIKHDNQTGKWVTPFRGIFSPKNVVTVGNMKRGVDLYDVKGKRIVELKSDSLSAIPAVNQWHPSLDILISANASGRVTLWT